MKLFKRKSGYALMEAMLSLTLIANGLAWKAKIDNNYRVNEHLRETVSAIDGIIYGMDKRVFLDGLVYSGGDESSEHAVDSYAMVKSLLVGVDDGSCSGGGWSATMADNSKTSLINCYALNPNKIPLGLDMSVNVKTAKISDALTSSSYLKSFKITLFAPTDAIFDKNSVGFLKLFKYSRMMNSPRITGSHKYFLVNRGTDEQVSTMTCMALKSECGLVAEYVTNEAGSSESPYLMVDGDNLMLGNLGFYDGHSSSTALKCTKVDDNGVSKQVSCGLELKINADPLASANNYGELDVTSTHSYSNAFYLTDPTTKGSGLPLMCKEGIGEEGKACGMVVVGDKAHLRVTDLTTKNAVFTDSLKNKSNTFSVDKDGGTRTATIEASGSITTIGNVVVKRSTHTFSKVGVKVTPDGMEGIGWYSGAGVDVKRGKLTLSGGDIVLNGGVARANGTALLDSNNTDLSGYVTKRFLGRFPMLMSVNYVNTDERVSLKPHLCLGDAFPIGVFVPTRTPISSVDADESACSNSWGERLIRWETIEIHRDESEGGMNSRSTKPTVRCSLSRDSWIVNAVKIDNQSHSWWHRHKSFYAEAKMKMYWFDENNYRHEKDIASHGALLTICPSIA